MSTEWAPGEAFQAILDGRSRVMPLTQPMIRKHSTSVRDLHELLASTGNLRARRPIGLMLALLVAKEAQELQSQDHLEVAVFRFAHHLRESAIDRQQPAGRRLALALGAKVAFSSLADSPRQALGEIDDLINDLRRVGTVPDWKDALGIDERELSRLLVVATGRRSADMAKPRLSTEGSSTPSWLVLPPPERGDPLRLAQANWRPEGADVNRGTLAEALIEGWAEFSVGAFGNSFESLAPVRASAGRVWSPSRELNSLYLWHWLRLVVFLGEMESEAGTDRRRALSAYELLRRLPIPSADLGDELVTAVTSDVAPLDPAANREWAVLTARLAYLSGHEAVVGGLSNAERSDLRSAWGRHLPGCGFQSDDTTQHMAQRIHHRLSEIASLSDRLPAQEVHLVPVSFARSCQGAQEFCDAMESELLATAQALAARFIESDRRAAAPPGVGLLEQLEEDLAGLRETVRESGSLLLQEMILPSLVRMEALLGEYTEEIAAKAKPDMEMQLDTKLLPLLDPIAAGFDVVAVVRNTGPVTARSVRLALNSPALTCAESTYVGDVAPGAERRVVIEAGTAKPSRTATLEFVLAWHDDYDQQFSKAVKHIAEAQRLSAWRANDPNPFQLTSIEDPTRLVGRTADIAALTSLLDTGGSTYVTGQKRVGKTSLVKVALRLLGGRGHATAMLPLGRALGARASADDLVLAMLDSLHGSIGRVRPDLDLPAIPEQIKRNFASAAGKWLDEVKSLTSPSLRAVIAIDDFDELPSSLIEGREGNALFLFLRTLVDEPWLSLVFVGSEVLPSMVRKQAHKLNLVSETRVGHLASSADTGELLRRPTRDRLDWEDRAVEYLHFLTAGSPYYATLAGQLIWQRMRESSRAFVQASDAEAAATEIAENYEPRHFLHFWADSPDGIDPDSDRARVASALLRGTAKCSVVPGAAARQSEVLEVAANWVADVPESELFSALGALIARRVILTRGDGAEVALSLPLLGVWLRSAGARYLDRDYYSASAVTRPDRYVISASEIFEISRDLYYCGERVNEIQIQAWLEHFEDAKSRALAFAVLSRLVSEGYFPAERVERELIPALAKAIRLGKAGAYQKLGSKGKRYLESFFLWDRGVPASSGDYLTRSLSAALGIRKQSNVLTTGKLVDATKTASGTSVIIAVEDFAGSGEQMTGMMEALLEALDRETPGWRNKVVPVAAVCLAAQEGLLDELTDLGVEVAVGEVAGERLHAFSPDAGIFETDADRLQAAELFEAVGKSLSPAIPLGYGGQALLVLFADNCPNNVPPAFWGEGRYAGEDWRAPFRRRY